MFRVFDMNILKEKLLITRNFLIISYQIFLSRRVLSQKNCRLTQTNENRGIGRRRDWKIECGNSDKKPHS